MKKNILHINLHLLGMFVLTIAFSSCGNPSCESQKQTAVEAQNKIYNDRMAMCPTSDCMNDAWMSMAIGISRAQVNYECCLDPSSCYSMTA